MINLRQKLGLTLGLGIISLLPSFSVSAGEKITFLITPLDNFDTSVDDLAVFAKEDNSTNLTISTPIISTIHTYILPTKNDIQSNRSELAYMQPDQSLAIKSSPNEQVTFSTSTWTKNKQLTPLQTSVWEVSQTLESPAVVSDNEETPVETPNSNSEEIPIQSPNTNEPQTDESQSNRWHFLFQPYLYLPITIYGDTTVGRFTGNINIGSNRIKTKIKDDLDFAFLGDIQAWTPDYHWGILADVNYLSTSSNTTFNRSIRYPGFADFIPSELQADVNAETWSVDLAAAYRFYDQSQVNPNGVSTEFDLGRFVFDVFGGLNITGINTNVDFTTNLGGEASFDGGTTVVSPTMGGSLRVNVAPKLALVTKGTVSGFGISGLWNWGVLGGLDWMFSGNTSLGLGYRFGYLSYNNNLNNGRDFGVTLNNNGPYMSFSFRF